MYEHNANTPVPFQSRASGKLLLTGEYFVLEGAQALAVPTVFGQSLLATVSDHPSKTLSWKSLEPDGAAWFSASFQLSDFEILRSDHVPTANSLQSILRAARSENPSFLQIDHAVQVKTQVDFPRNWGLGSSSTLIAAIARWANADPYALLAGSFGGSGYDLACAYANGPILYQIIDKQGQYVDVCYHPKFADSLYFLYLDKKQNSREGIERYRKQAGVDHARITAVTQLTSDWLNSSSLKDLEEVISRHEALVSETLGLSPAKALFFPDFWGEIKSLGAWGGDFVLATSARSEEETHHYFKQKGFHTLLPWRKMVLNP